MLAILCTAAPISGQTVVGRVTDGIAGTPIANADVVLLGADEGVVGHAITSEWGRFWIRAPRPGIYRVRITRIGYQAFTSDTLVLSPGESATIEPGLQPTPAELPAVDVQVARRSARLARDGFYQRMVRGIGYFLRPEDLEEMKPLFPEDLFSGMPGVRVLANGKMRSVSSGCDLTVAIDGVRVIDDWWQVVHVKDIEALEVYPRPAGVPFWLFGSGSPCGAVVIWTK